MNGKYSKPLSRWFAALRALTVGLCLFSLAYFSASTAKAAAFLLMAMVLAKIIPIEAPGGAEMTLSSALDITAALVLGPAASVVCLAADTLASATATGSVRRALSHMHSDAYIAHDALATGAAGFMAARLGFAGLTDEKSLGVALICGGIYMLVHAILESITGAIRYNINPLLTPAMAPANNLVATVAQVGLGVFAVYAFGLLPLTATSLIGTAAFVLLVLYAARLYVDMRSTYWGTIFALIPAIESEFDYGVGHARRVSAYSLAMARKLALDDSAAAGVYVGAMLHDMGMVGVDDQIVNRPGRLSAEEHTLVRRHVELGAGIVEKAPLLAPSLGAVKYHHERWDGSGYPDGLKGQDIPIGARIVAIADVFDGLISRRPHRDAMTPQAALEEIRKGAGQSFDPEIIVALERAVEDELRWGKSVFEQHYSIDFDR